MTQQPETPKERLAKLQILSHAAMLAFGLATGIFTERYIASTGAPNDAAWLACLNHPGSTRLIGKAWSWEPVTCFAGNGERVCAADPCDNSPGDAR